MVSVSSFHDNRGPRSCYNCHRFNHIQKECKTLLDVHGVRKQDITAASKANRSAAIVEETIQQHTRSAQNTGNSKRELSAYVVMIRSLNILQANLWKQLGVQDALYNDPDIWEFDAIFIQEPHYSDIGGNI